MLTPWNCDRQVALLVICADAREANASATMATTAAERVLDMASIVSCRRRRLLEDGGRKTRNEELKS